MLEDEYGKEVILLKSSLSQSMFNHFTATYPMLSKYQKSHLESFVYVDSLGKMKLVTNVVSTEDNEQGDIFAVSVAKDGWVEFLSFDNQN